MKLLLRITAIAAFASTLLAGSDALAGGEGGHGRGHDRGEWRQDRRESRDERGPRDYREDRGGPGPGDYREYRGRGRDRRDYREDPRERWDEGPVDRYYVPAPPNYARRPPPVFGLRRGGMAPPQFRGAEVPDYARHRLRPPPPGYAWVHMGDRYMLVSRATGQIFDVIGD